MRAVPMAAAMLAFLVLAPPARADLAERAAHEGAGGGFTVAADPLLPPAAPFVLRHEVSPFATPAPAFEDGGGLIAQRGMGPSPRRPRRERARADSAARDSAAEARRGRSAGRALPIALSPERARIMLQSLTVPGWGQATLGQRRSAGLFALLEAGVWGSFAAFRIQERMRRDTYERTAAIYAGIDLEGRDEEFRRIVGFYASNEEYNRLVVRRDAANLYYGDPAAYDAYVAEHELKGGDTWSWESETSLQRYRTERQLTQRAAQRAHTAIAAAVINRLVSVVHASRAAAQDGRRQTSWTLECVPAGNDPTAVRLGVRADF